ncbi:MAG: type II toxin-antitoxin system RelE/ParE family toxin [Dehalococcoidia bacterium]|nr:type II toxin-antitoxin system RelE/ParE family toxin [Dehalococcoidia bacterium]
MTWFPGWKSFRPVLEPAWWIGSRNGWSQLEAFPESGRIVPEFDERVFRELVEGDYRIIYERFADRVEVVAVVHGSRSLLDS